MTAAVSTIDIARPPDQVFSYVTDPSRFAEWQDDVVGVHLESAGPVGLGARFTTARRIGGVERTMTQEVTEDRPPHRWAVHGVDGPIRPRMTITVEPLDEGARSRVTFALDFVGHGIGVPLVPMVRRMAAKGAPASYRHLKDRLEAGVS
ncbi:MULTISPECIES: SRPBCC family protein [unclassified Micromonospora]|uniref:SRPBCC family protein n=1 Tax=unclassified Micromonospora TaxID=2617518 RepID=UPI002FF1CBC9